MIAVAGRKRRRTLAVLTAALAFAQPSRAAAAFDAALASLAGKTAALVGRGEAVTVTFRNQSALAPAEWSGLRSAFEAALRDAGTRVADTGAVEARITVSETPSQYLLVEEARKGDERQVWIAAWSREAPGNVKTGGPSIDLKQVWRQTEQILDIAFVPAGMLVLSPSKLTLYTRVNDAWTLKQASPLASPKPWPRDLRGRIRITGSTFQVFLPGLACNGALSSAAAGPAPSPAPSSSSLPARSPASSPASSAAAPSLEMDCRASEAPWVLESGSRGLLLAAYASARNYFDGRVVTQSGARKTVPPFYSAASAESQGRTFWVLAQTDGRAEIMDAALEPLAPAGQGSPSQGAIAQWGSDIAGIDARCGGSSQVLATRAGDANEPDALQSFTISERSATPVTGTVTLPGPVTALWPSGASAALAVARDLVSGDFIAYVASVACAN